MRRGFALVPVLFLVLGCASVRPAPERSEIIRRILSSTVQLRSEWEAGRRRVASGVVLAADPASNRAWIVTARHFLEPLQAPPVYARRPGRNEAVRVTIVARYGRIPLGTRP